MAKSMVYVIDSDDSVRRAFARLLQSEGLGAETFASASDFLASPRQMEHSCIVLEFPLDNPPESQVMGKLAGCGLLAPIIVVSASDSAQDRRRARQVQAVSFFRKPVDGQALVDAIRWALASIRTN